MRGNWLLATSSSGGTGALTLAGVSGWPNFTAMLGTSGSRLIEYEIVEYTDASKTVPAKFESGIGSLALSTGVLTRSKVERTYDGTAYKPNAAGDAPTALSFGTTPANILIFCGPSVEDVLSPGVAPAAYQDDIGQPIEGYIATSWSSVGFGSYISYWPIRFGSRQPQISQVSLRVNTADASATSSEVHFALYEYGTDGKPGALLADFGNLGAVTSVATLSGTLATPIVNPRIAFAAMFGVSCGSGGIATVPCATLANIVRLADGQDWPKIGIYDPASSFPDPAIVNVTNAVTGHYYPLMFFK